jgi:uncharacterized repeat protein (TIGR01451 family)
MRHLIPIALLAVASAAPAQVQTSWANAPGGVSVARDATDHVFTARWDYNPAGDIWVAKRAPDGTVLWEVRYDNTDTTRHEVATWVATDSAGNALVSGTIRSGFASPVNAASVLMKFSPQGQLLWRRVFSTDFDGSSTVRVLVDAQDRAYAVGLGVGPLGMVSSVRQFNADGSPGWVWFDGVGIGAPVNAKRTPDGATLVIGRGIFGSINGYAKVSASGQTLWSFVTPSLTLGDSAGDAAGNAYVVHQDYGASGSVLRKFSPTGTQLWEQRHPMSAFRVEVMPDGGAMLSGFPDSGTGGAAFARFDPAGGLLWTNPSADGVGLLLHAQMVLDTAGNAYLAGSNLSQMGVTRVNADGTAGWTALVPFGTSASLALGSQRQVYVTGGQTARLDQDPPPPGVDLVLALGDAPDPVTVFGRLTYTATLRNAGNGPAASVRFTLPLPSTVRWRASAASQGSCSGSTTVTCELGGLAAGATASVQVDVMPRRRGTLQATATASAVESDLHPDDNSATASTTVNPRR